MAVRRGALRNMTEGLVSAAAELAANGISTAMLAQEARRTRPRGRRTMPVGSGHCRLQLRVEHGRWTSRLLRKIERCGIGYVVFNDHLPHDALAAGRTPGVAGWRSDAHLALMRNLHQREAGGRRAGRRPARAGRAAGQP